MQDQRTKTSFITKVAILSSIAYILMLIEFPIPFMPPFLKIDFSEIPVLISAFALGPLSGVVVELIKNLIHLFMTQSAGIGEMANFFVGVSYILPAGLIYKYIKNKKGAVIGVISGTLVMVGFASIFNYFVFLPLYASLFKLPMDAIIQLGNNVNKNVVDVKTLIAFGIVPFNLIKGIIVSLIVLLIYKPLSPILHKNLGYSSNTNKI